MQTDLTQKQQDGSREMLAPHELQQTGKSANPHKMRTLPRRPAQHLQRLKQLRVQAHLGMRLPPQHTRGDRSSAVRMVGARIALEQRAHQRLYDTELTEDITVQCVERHQVTQRLTHSNKHANRRIVR